MISEVPLGAFLSGGVDSSAVVATMARLSAEPVNTCSIAFADPAFDESRFAQQVAERYQHAPLRRPGRERRLRPDRRRSRALYDEPYADSSAIPTYRVCQLARKHVTVALSGDGGDESFGGYRRYRLHLMEERMRARAAAGAAPPAVRPARHASIRRPTGRRACFRAKIDLRGAGARLGRGVLPRRVDPARRRCAAQLFSPTLPRAARRLQRASRSSTATRAGAGTDDPLALIQYLDLKTYLVGDINTKVDRASMAHSLEVREPLMDHTLVEWLATLPSSLKVRGQEGKCLLKKAMEPHLPREVLYRPKMGFAVPLARWFRGPLRAARARRRCSASGSPPPASSTAATCASWSSSTSRARATTARRCGRC